jgi:putative redox protein
MYQYPRSKSIGQGHIGQPASSATALTFPDRMLKLPSMTTPNQEGDIMPEVAVTITQIDRSSAARTRIRSHELVTDRPKEKGGGNQGPMGGELLVASLGGCFMSNLIAAFQGRGLDPSGLSMTVRGTLDGTPPRFQKMAVQVDGADVDGNQMEKLVLIAERGCIVANTLKQGLEVEIAIV